MPDKHPIDYARAESDDVVRKKFRRRVVWFVMATVVVMVVGLGWRYSWLPVERSASISKYVLQPLSLESRRGWVIFFGPPSTTDQVPPISKMYLNNAIGVKMTRSIGRGFVSWYFGMHYRTLFLLAMIPWIITLIRLIRVARVKQTARIDQ